MFDNIGSKIKKLAMLVSGVGIIIFAVLGIAIWVNGDSGEGLLDFANGLITFVAGGILSWVGGFFAYGFGQLIENTDIIAANMEKKPDEEKAETKLIKVADAAVVSLNPKKQAKTNEAEEETEGYSDFECPECGEMLSFSAEEIQKGTELYCPFCNEKLYVRKN